MDHPVPGVSRAPEHPDPLAHADTLELARHATAAQVEKLVRGYRRVGRPEDCERAEAQ